MTPSKIYVYALTRSGDLALGPCGLKDAEVYAVSSGDLAAVVSEVEASARIRPRRRDLRSHHGVLERLLEKGPVLPMSFGTLVDDVEEIRGLLDDQRDRIEEQLEKVDAAVEMSVRVEWPVDNVFEALLEGSEELRGLRDEAAARGDRTSMIAMGERLAEALEGERAAIETILRDRLEPICRAVRSDEPRSETEMVRLSLLVDRDGREAMEEAVQEAAKQLADHLVIHLSGPWAPHSFIELELVA